MPPIARGPRLARRLGAGNVLLGALVGVVLLLIVGIDSGIDALRDQGVLPATGGGTTDGSGITVVLPGAEAVPPDGASGGVHVPGPDGAAGGESGVGQGGATGQVSPVLPGAAGGPEPSSRRGIVRVPNLLVAFVAILAHAGGADAAFVYRAALEARDGGDTERAIDLFDAVAASGGVLTPFAALRAAQAVAGEAITASEDSADALSLVVERAASRFSSLIAPTGDAERLPADVQAVALLEGAQAFDRAGWQTDALAAVERVESLPVSAGTRAQAASERARLLAAMGDASWTGHAVRAMELAPGSPASRAALDLLDGHGASYPGLTGAYVAYRSSRNADAIARYEALIDRSGGGVLTDSEMGVAWFYLGALRERSWGGEAAIEAYAASIEADPDGQLAADARYWRGRVLEELGRPLEAAGEYDRLTVDFPSSRFVEDARLRAAVALGLAGEGAAATGRLAAITRTGSADAAAEAAHWHAVLVSLFDAPPADVAPAATYDPTSYVAAFEQSGMAVTGPLPFDAVTEMAEAIPLDRTAIDVWLAGHGRAREATAAVLQDQVVRLAWTLTAAGESGVARGLLQLTIGERRGQPYELVALAEEARRHGLHDVAMRAAQAVLAPFGPFDRLDAPRGLLGLAYPVPYLPETESAATEFGVPVLLLYALMRQESAFHPEAGSSAGAFGLTQVIPPTGEYIAGALGESDWRFADLARPEVAARFGAYYLSLQLGGFDGHMLAALAAYNGGPGNAARWLQSQQFAGPDGYLYAVDFTETRLYLELVSSNYAMYRFIYLGLETPGLPH
ncbi:MAG: transglycosylase SLT domain-containing protein [Chloroflexi bacterium]|nr:transglycosylase SLT domain-containing protein [Chloroflexota bacterium]